MRTGVRKTPNLSDLLCLHHGQRLTSPLYWGNKQYRATGDRAQGKTSAWLFGKVQHTRARVRTAVRRYTRGHNERKTAQRLAKNQKERSDRIHQSALEEFKRGMARMSTQPPPHQDVILTEAN